MAEQSIETNLGDLDVVVEFDFDPGRPAQMYGDDAHPEEHPDVCINAVLVGEFCILDKLNTEALNDLEEKCLIAMSEG